MVRHVIRGILNIQQVVQVVGLPQVLLRTLFLWVMQMTAAVLFVYQQATAALLG
jgi:hypothetical protein